MISISMVCLFIALLCFVLAAFSLPTGRLNLVALGLCFAILARIIGPRMLL